MDDEPTFQVLIADDQASVRSALRLALAQQPDITVVGEAADATGLLLAAAQQAADVLLLDWELPGLPATHLLRLLRYERPSLLIVAMSSRPEARWQALQSGVCAFLSKGAPPESVLDTLARLRFESGFCQK